MNRLLEELTNLVYEYRKDATEALQRFGYGTAQAVAYRSAADRLKKLIEKYESLDESVEEPTKKHHEDALDLIIHNARTEHLY